MDYCDWFSCMERYRQEEEEYERQMQILAQKRKEIKERRIAAQKAHDELMKKEKEMRQLRTNLPEDWKELPDEMLVAVEGYSGIPIILTKGQLLKLIGQQRKGVAQIWKRRSEQVYPVYRIRDCDYVLVPVLDGRIRHWEKMMEGGTLVWIRG